MIILKIKEKGHYIEIPGMTPFRTPVEANITHISIPLVVSRLQTQGIDRYEIVSDTQGKKSVLNQNDFAAEKNSKRKNKEIKRYEKRFNKLETLITKLLDKKPSESNKNKEQITNKLSNIEKLLLNKQDVIVSQKKSKKEKKKKDSLEVDETFIPDINISGLSVKGGGSKESIKQDNVDIDDSADLLSRIMEEK